MSSPVIQSRSHICGFSPCAHRCYRSWSSVQRRRVQQRTPSAKPWASWACSSISLRTNVSHFLHVNHTISIRQHAVTEATAATQQILLQHHGVPLCPQTTLTASPSCHRLARTRSRFWTSVPKAQRSSSSSWRTWRSPSRRCRRWSRYASSVSAAPRKVWFLTSITGDWPRPLCPCPLYLVYRCPLRPRVHLLASRCDFTYS